MANIIERWNLIKLENLLDFYIGGDWGEQEPINSNYIETKVLRATDISNWENDHGENAQIRYLKDTSLAKRQLKENDLIIEVSGGSPDQPVGRTIIMSSDDIQKFQYPVTCSNFFRLLRFNNKINPKFINYYFKFLYETKIIESYQSNSTNLRNLKFSQFLNQNIPVPQTLCEQQEIVDVLDAASEIIRLRTACIESAQSLIPALFQEMFGDIKNNTKNWKSCNLNDLVYIDRKNISVNELKSNAYRYIGLEHIEKDTGKILIDLENNFNVDLKSNKYYFTNEHVLYGKLRPYLNKVALPTCDGVCSTDIFPIMPRKNISNKYFIKYLMSSPYFVQITSLKTSGANLPRIVTKALELIKVICPDIELQNQFAAKVQEIEEYIKSQQAELENAKTMFQSLLHHSFTGELTRRAYGE